ncbi:chromosome partitioning protein [Altererythrobacter salegens]|uniref:Chromosome partitioning protein n=1 Tax=Croceibacterium salegens TaxID=1737568 RepID=A0A6I4SXG7_9SPHN|nr:CpsD/CapB family tyrosine-protein kinase [Croceibacterium salegens]MXO60715.1 chromosome partitioning protein [Croceibacterium salegens]
MAEADPPEPFSRTLLALESMPVVDLASEALLSHNIVGFESRDIRSRPFNILRTRFTKGIAGRDARLVGITSATPGAGKSFLSLNLAASLARLAETPVYLVDLDLRRSSVSTELGLEDRNGLGEYLAGEIDELSEIGVRIEGVPLAIFPTGSVLGNSAEYLATSQFANMIGSLRENADGAIVLFDLPPVFASDDAMLSIEALDGYLLVVDSGTTNRRQITDAMEMLRPSPCLGTILNRYKGGLTDHYGYGTGAYDKYYRT